MIRRDWHWTDEPVVGDKRRRVLANWSNYKDATGWHATDLKFTRAEVGDTFLGRQLDWVSKSSPLQWFVGDSASTNGLPWFGFRKSDDTDTQGIVTFVVDADASGGYTVNGAEKSATWEDILPGTDQILYAGTHTIERWLSLANATAGVGGFGDRVDLGFILPDGWTLEVEDSGTNGNRILFKNGQGKTRFHTKPARAYDQRLDADGNPQAVPCAFLTRPSITLGGYTVWVVRKRIDKTGVVYPVLMDDTTTISDVAAIQETMVLGVAGQQNYNWGQNVYLYQGTNGTPYHGLYQFPTALIPAGTIDTFTHSFYAYGYPTERGNLLYRAISDANVWVEGSKSSAVGSGTDCTYLKRSVTPDLDWAGSIGLSMVGVDTHAEASYVQSYTAPGIPAGRYNFDLPVIWPTNWRDGVWVNNGFKMDWAVTSIAGARGYTHRSSEWTTPSQRPYFVIEYTVPPAGLMLEACDPYGSAPRRRPVRRPSKNPRV